MGASEHVIGEAGVHMWNVHVLLAKWFLVRSHSVHIITRRRVKGMLQRRKGRGHWWRLSHLIHTRHRVGDLRGSGEECARRGVAH